MKISEEKIKGLENELELRYFACKQSSQASVNQAALQGFTDALDYLGLQWTIRKDGTASIWSEED
jgi:hypothetical protein